MKYQSLCVWRDLTDGHLYQAGETFPHNGKKVSPERLSALESGNNKAGYPLITRVGQPEEPEKAEPVKEPEAVEPSEDPVTETEEAPKTKRRKTK